MMIHDMVFVKNRTLEADMYYKNALVLEYKIQYPWFVSSHFYSYLIRINGYYATKATIFERYCKRDLYKSAEQLYEDSIQNEFPFHAFDAILDYTITYNQDCALSLYFDQYEYTGGAHGNTIRRSDTWNLQTSCPYMLSHLFTPSVPYKKYITSAINYQISNQIANGNNIYFDDYEKNVSDYFDPRNFYLAENGIVIYYQQYQIAPYSSGIPEFTIPYSNMVIRPKCP